MSYDRFSSWQDDAEDDIKPKAKPAPEVKAAPVVKKQEPSDSPEDVVEMISALDSDEELCLDLDIDTFNKVYSIIRKSKLYSNLPSYSDGKLKFRKN